MKDRIPNLGKIAAGWVVLIIDDTPDNLTVAMTALKFHGAEVHTARSGETGLDLLQTIRPTLILLDIRMPFMDGWTTFRILRDNPVTARIPVIAITAYAMEGDQEKTLEAGFDGYISKPFDMFTFVSTIDQILRQINPQHKEDDL